MPSFEWQRRRVSLWDRWCQCCSSSIPSILPTHVQLIAVSPTGEREWNQSLQVISITWKDPSPGDLSSVLLMDFHQELGKGSRFLPPKTKSFFWMIPWDHFGDISQEIIFIGPLTLSPLEPQWASFQGHWFYRARLPWHWGLAAIYSDYLHFTSNSRCLASDTLASYHPEGRQGDWFQTSLA